MTVMAMMPGKLVDVGLQRRCCTGQDGKMAKQGLAFGRENEGVVGCLGDKPLW
jgi:hypothetical protein